MRITKNTLKKLIKEEMDIALQRQKAKRDKLVRGVHASEDYLKRMPGGPGWRRMRQIKSDQADIQRVVIDELIAEMATLKKRIEALEQGIK